MTEERSVPASPAQARLWFLDRFRSGGCAYNNANLLRICGPLDPGTLRAAIAEIVRRHETLRTRFPPGEAGPAPLVSPVREPEVPLADLSALPPGPRRREAARLARQEARRPLDLARGPLFRFLLLRLAAEEHALVYVVHHIVSDRWSLHVFLRELQALCAPASRGVLPPLAPVSPCFAELEKRRRSREGDGRLDASISHWREHLGATPPALDLPTDRPWPAVEPHEGGRYRLRVPADGVRRIAGEEGATPFMAWRAAFEALLFLWSGSTEFVVGTPVAGRWCPETEPLIGLFLNVLPVRCDLGGNPTYREALRRTRERMLEALARADVPFETLVERLGVPRDTSRSPIFQVVCNFHNVPPVGPGRSGLAIQVEEIDTGAARYALTLTLRESTEGCEATFEYARALFDRATIARLAGRFRRIAERVGETPDLPLSRLDLVPEEERRRILAFAGDPSPPPRPLPSLPEMVEARSRQHPAREAVRGAGALLTYGDVATRSRAVAAALAARGIGGGAIVAVLLGRTPRLPVGLLGVLRSGAAYLPLDPDWPDARIAGILAQARPDLVLSERAFRARVPEALLMEELPAAPDAARAPPAPEDPAYLIHTSGSTGRPKGVVVPHRALSNLLRSMAREPGFGEEEVLAAITSPSFDIAALELFLPLVAGGRVAIAPREVAADGKALARFLREEGAGVLQATPSTWRLLASEPSLPPGLRGFSGGETLPRDLARALLRRGVELWNLYGPTETTVWSARHRVGEEEGPVPIGRPVDGTAIHVVDREGRLAPLGVPGEIWIAGVGVADGYRGLPDLTAERFLPNPFGPGRVYRTGDIGRLLPSGLFVHRGRSDEQMKVRGHRVEPMEIEGALCRHPLVREAAVALQGDRLAAWCVLRDERVPEVAELRRTLAETLPPALVPSLFRFVGALPRTTGGKIDRRSLSDAGGTRAGARETPVPPRNEEEARLASLFEEVLGIRPVGIRDEFFELGGHSLLAAGLVRLVERECGADLSLVDFFRSPTVEGVAALLRGGRAAGEEGVVALREGGAGAPLFLLGVGGGALARALGRRLGGDRPFYALLEGPGDPESVDGRTVPALASRLLSRIRAVEAPGPLLLLGFCGHGVVAFEMAKQALAAGIRVGFLGVIEARGPRRRGAGYRLRRGLYRQWTRLRYHAARLADAESWRERAGMLAEAVAASARRAADRVRRPRETLRALATGERMLPADIHLEWRYNVAMWRAYSLRAAPFAGRIHLFTGHEARFEHDPTWGWFDLARDGVVPHAVTGRHLDMLREPHVALLAETVDRAIALEGG